jgi:F-type H+-transporting ATPase subunit delta
MATTRAAERYAKAIMEIATEEKSLDAVVEDFRTLQGAIGGSKDLRSFLHSPIIDERTKSKILEEIFRGKLSPVTERFIQLLTRKGRAVDLIEIVSAFFRLLDVERNVVNAEITVAVEPGPDQRKGIEERLRKLSGKEIRAVYLVDPSLIGGFRARFADTMIDASVRHQLDRIHASFVEGILN